MATGESRRSRKRATPATTMSDTPRLEQLGRFLLRGLRPAPARWHQRWRGLDGDSAGGVSAPAPRPGDRGLIRSVGQRQCPAHPPTPPTSAPQLALRESSIFGIEQNPSPTFHDGIG